MVFKKRIIEEDVPVATPIVTPVAQPVIERNTTIERDSMGGGTAIAVILAGILIIAMVWYFAWYQPSTVAVQPSTNTTVIDHTDGTAAQPIVTAPASPVIVNPPATTKTENTTIVTPPANNTTVVNPPSDSTTTTTPNGDGTSTTTTAPTTTGQ